jgi:hypothetical protein
MRISQFGGVDISVCRVRPSLRQTGMSAPPSVFLGTVPIFVSAKMGLSPFPGDTAPMASLTQKSVQALFLPVEKSAHLSPHSETGENLSGCRFAAPTEPPVV